MHQGTERAKTRLPQSCGELLASQAERILPILVLLVAIFLRLYNLDKVPSGLSYDESVNGVDALRILNGERPIFLIENSGREVLFIYLQALGISFVGQTDFALRVVPAIMGLLTVVVTYPLVRRMFDARVALLTCAWLSVSFWHVIFSRVALRSISLPLLLSIGFYCLWRGLEGVGARTALHSGSNATAKCSRPAIWFALGGTVIGISLYTYTPARFAPLVILALALYVALLHRRLLRQTLPGFALALALTTLVFLPLGFFFLNHPESLLERIQQVWMLNPELHRGSPGQALFDSALRTLGMFAIRGDHYWHSNIAGRPIFDPLSALLMLMGIALAVRRFREPAFGFIVIWLFVMFLPSLLAIQDTPNPIRATALIPAIFILPALGTTRLWEAWESRMSGIQTRLPAVVLRQIPLLFVTMAFLSGAFYTYYSYFELWAKTPELWRNFDSKIFLPLASFETVEEARRLAKTDHEPIFVAIGDFDTRRMGATRITLSDQPEAQYIRTFDPGRSIIFPADHASARYLFPPDPDPLDIHTMHKYFDVESAQIIGPSPSIRPIMSYRLLDPRPPFQPESPVPARFGDQIFVYGFDMPKDVRAGEVMTVRWYWRLLATDDRDVVFTNQLFGEDGHRRGQLDDRGFAPDYWPIGTSGVTTFAIDIEPEAPTGAYWLRVAMYHRRGQEVSNLPIFDAQGDRAGNHLRLGPIKVHGNPSAQAPEASDLDLPVPDSLLRTSFADQIDLQGYSLSDHSLVPGETLDLTLFWSPRGRPNHDYTVFVHLLDSLGQLRGQADAPPKSGKYPTSVWDAGETIADLHTLALSPDLPAGEFRVAIGLYDPETGQRVPMEDENGQTSGDHVIISGLVVEVD